MEKQGNLAIQRQSFEGSEQLESGKLPETFLQIAFADVVEELGKGAEDDGMVKIIEAAEDDAAGASSKDKVVLEALDKGAINEVNVLYIVENLVQEMFDQRIEPVLMVLAQNVQEVYEVMRKMTDGKSKSLVAYHAVGHAICGSQNRVSELEDSLGRLNECLDGMGMRFGGYNQKKTREIILPKEGVPIDWKGWKRLIRSVLEQRLKLCNRVLFSK